MDQMIPSPRTGLSRLPASFVPHAVARAAGDTGIMFFLFRVAFWLSIVLILLPNGSSQSGAPANQVGAGEAVTAASATVTDLRQFCSRQPEACSIGTQVAMSIGYKAQAGAKMLYEFLSDKLAPRETGSIASSTGKADKAAHSSQNTLTPADLAPTWRGPQARKDAKHSV
jgi:hypothetical protein